MVRAGHHVIIGGRVELAQLRVNAVGVDQTVAIAGDDHAGRFVLLKRAVGDGLQGRRNQRDGPGLFVQLLVRANHPRAERIAAEPDPVVVDIGKCAQEVHRHKGFLVFLLALGVLALAVADAAEVEAQRGDAGVGQAEGHRYHHVVVHAAAVQRMGVAHHHAGKRALAVRQSDDALEGHPFRYETDRALSHVGASGRVCAGPGC